MSKPLRTNAEYYIIAFNCMKKCNVLNFGLVWNLVINQSFLGVYLPWRIWTVKYIWKLLTATMARIVNIWFMLYFGTSQLTFVSISCDRSPSVYLLSSLYFFPSSSPSSQCLGSLGFTLTIGSKLVQRSIEEKPAAGWFYIGNGLSLGRGWRGPRVLLAK